VEVINAKFFPAYFEGLPENRTAAELWEGLQGLGGKNAPTDRLADVLVTKTGQKSAWMTKIFLKSEKDRQDKENNGCPQNESTRNWESRGWGARMRLRRTSPPKAHKPLWGDALSAAGGPRPDINAPQVH